MNKTRRGKFAKPVKSVRNEKPIEQLPEADFEDQFDLSQDIDEQVEASSTEEIYTVLAFSDNLLVVGNYPSLDKARYEAETWKNYLIVLPNGKLQVGYYDKVSWVDATGLYFTDTCQYSPWTDKAIEFLKALEEQVNG